MLFVQMLHTSLFYIYNKKIYTYAKADTHCAIDTFDKCVFMLTCWHSFCQTINIIQYRFRHCRFGNKYNIVLWSAGLV